VDQIDSSHYKFFSVPSYVFESKGLVDVMCGRRVGLTSAVLWRHDIPSH
jgi:hypothetical protein